MEIPRNYHQVQAPDNDEGDQSEGIEDGDNCRSEGVGIQESRQETLFSSDYYHQQFEVLLPQDLNEKSMDSHLIKWCDLVSSEELMSSTASNNKKLEQEGFNLVPKLKAKRRKAGVIEIHGSRVVQPTGRKDRHSKVCTARGTRDRRLRLSPKTAIQFYDVQDRLGYDRPSKAIDWLMKEAKAVIDALDDESPPPLVINNNYSINVSSIRQHQKGKIQQMQEESCRILISESEMIQKHECHLNDQNSISSFSFFANGSGPSSSTEFQTYSGDDFNSSKIRSQHPEDSILYATYPSHILNTNIEMDRFQRFFNWNCSYENSGNAGGETESFISSLPPHFSAPSVLDPNHIFSQREPLQSSIYNYSPISTRFPDMRLANDEFSYVTTAATVKEDDKETNPVSSNPSSAASFLHYED